MPETPRVVMDPSATYRRLVPVDRLAPPVTPSDDVYVIAHMGIARVDVKGWRLRVDGLVERPFALDYDALTSLPATEVTAVLECFGNPVEPDVATRRVGNVVWRGVRLSHLLERAGVRPDARLVCPEGLDSGTFATVHSDRYVKDLPLARALEPDVLVAWALNGEPLSAEHGFPARVVVPGYFGTNNVKWLSRLTLAAERPESLFTTRLYMRGAEPVRDLDVHAVIVAPADGALLERGRQTVLGWAWSAAPVRAVEVSTDAGQTWHPARIEARGADHQWQAFTREWEADAPGTYELHVRATDARGHTQPAAGRNRIHIIKITVEG
ncbi:MAG TPA: molybdopterin-dependent oxidoreductase [Methylomirabilota bacterium]|nr:molybdopterin-dependent oxidoreductase [Methylomirabilota bacterium]